MSVCVFVRLSVISASKNVPKIVMRNAWKTVKPRTCSSTVYTVYNYYVIFSSGWYGVYSGIILYRMSSGKDPKKYWRILGREFCKNQSKCDKKGLFSSCSGARERRLFGSIRLGFFLKTGRRRKKRSLCQTKQITSRDHHTSRNTLTW